MHVFPCALSVLQYVSRVEIRFLPMCFFIPVRVKTGSSLRLVSPNIVKEVLTQIFNLRMFLHKETNTVRGHLTGTFYLILPFLAVGDKQLARQPWEQSN